MKKKRLIYPMIALACVVCAGILVTGCPSEPDPAPAKLVNPDLYFEKGVFWYDWWNEETQTATQRFNRGRAYEVTFDLTQLDEILGGCHFQAQLFFTNPLAPDTDYLLAGSRNAVPSVINSMKGKKYRFTFTVGDLEASGDDSEKTKEERAEEGGYEIPISIPIQLPPERGMVRLKVTLKTPNWYTVGIPWAAQEQNEDVNPRDDPRDWGVDYYDPAITLGANGRITVRQKPSLDDYSPSPTAIKVNVDVETTGKGSIGDSAGESMFSTLAYSPVDALLKVVFFAVVDTPSNAKQNDNAAAPGWGVIEFGNGQEGDKQRGQNINLAVNIPSKTDTGADVRMDGSTQGPFTEYIYVEDVMATAFEGENWIAVNVYRGARIAGYDPAITNDPVGLTLMFRNND